MKTSRRTFLKTVGTATAGVAISPGIVACTATKNGDVKFINTPNEVRKTGKQRFNMCGYAAPRLETVRIGFIGLGHRGPLRCGGYV